MNKVIDLSTMVKDDLVFKMVNGDEFIIPGQVSLEFVMMLSKLEEDLKKAVTVDKQIQILQRVVLDILQLDTSKDIDITYVEENIADIRLLRVIMESMVNHIQDVMADESL